MLTPVVHVVAVRIARTTKISPPTPPATPRPRAGPESSPSDTASGQKSHTQSARRVSAPASLAAAAGAPAARCTSQGLPASLCRPALAAGCAAQVSPATVRGGRRGGQRGTFPGAWGSPRPPSPARPPPVRRSLSFSLALFQASFSTCQ